MKIIKTSSEQTQSKMQTLKCIKILHTWCKNETVNLKTHSLRLNLKSLQFKRNKFFGFQACEAVNVLDHDPSPSSIFAIVPFHIKLVGSSSSWNFFFLHQKYQKGPPALLHCEHHVTLEFNHFCNTNLIKQTVSNINEMKDAHKDHCSR